LKLVSREAYLIKERRFQNSRRADGDKLQAAFCPDETGGKIRRARTGGDAALARKLLAFFQR
jgi:hypothetical protein